MPENNEPATDEGSKSSDGKSPSRRIFGTKRLVSPGSGTAQPDLEEKLASLVDSVKGLQSHFSNAKTAGDTPADPEPKQRKLRRFQRVAGDDAVDVPAGPIPVQEASGDETTLNKNIAWPRLARVDETFANANARNSTPARKHPIIIWALVQIAGLGLLLLGYWAGQSRSDEDEGHPGRAEAVSSALTAPADLLTRVGVNDRALDAVNQGLHAEKTGDSNGARQIWQSAVSSGLPLAGANYRLAMLDIQRADLTEADIHLSKSLAAGEMMASCYFVNAWFAGQKGNYTEAVKQIAQAVRVEPFNAKYLFCWGEALRRAGKAQAGVDAITRALERPASPSDIELYTFKLGLAKIEAGHDEAFAAEIADHLSKKSVTGDWPLLAAARDLNHGVFPAAAGHLAEAARVLTPEVFDLLVHDFAFQAYATRPEIAMLLKVPPPQVSPPPVDYGAWPAEEADPAVWQPIAPAL